MWSLLYSSPEQSAFFLLLCLSMSRLLSECQILYDWDYDDDKATLPTYPVRSYGPTDFPVDSDAEDGLLFYYDEDGGQGPREMTEAGAPAPGLPRRRPPAEASAALKAGRLSPEKTWLLREHLKGLYALLKAHPALMDRRLRVGSRRPDIPPHHPDYYPVAMDSQPAAAAVVAAGQLQYPAPSHSPQPQLTPDMHDLPAAAPGGQFSPPPAAPLPSPDKRSFTHLSSSVVCPARTEWRRLRVARDINNTEVEVFQPREGEEGHQWFYTITCEHDHDHDHLPPSLRRPEAGLEDCPSCCRGVNRHRYHSHCMTKTSFMMALVRKPGDQQYDWNWIQVNSSCTCFISPV